MRRGFILFPALFLLPGSSSAAAQAETHSHRAGREAAVLGSVSFENSGNPAAQEPFLRGLALLHSFEYWDAGEAFHEARHADPDFALAYWMQALTTEHPVWGERDVAAARGILAHLGSTTEERLAKAATPRERAYGAAIEALFADSADDKRLRAFADSVRQLPRAYPDDLDAAAFAALAAIAVAYTLPPAEREALIDEAIAHGERVFRENQQHPGAAHYLIHAYDDPRRAARGLPFARAYALIAPDAEHALHMPSHIFVQLGLWADVAASNERAWTASRAWTTDRGLSGAHLDFHSLAWLQYAYLQQGRYHAARAIIDTARAVLIGADSDPSVRTPSALYAPALLTFQYAAETGDWDITEGMWSGLAPVTGESPRDQFFARINAYQEATAALLRGDTALAAARAEALEPPESMSWIHAAALLARARGEREQALALFRDAASRESPGASGPPLLLPSHELLGQALLLAGDAAEAVRSYEKSLEQRPNRALALLGLARARAATGDRGGAVEAYRMLRETWNDADADSPSLAEVREAVGERRQ